MILTFIHSDFPIRYFKMSFLNQIIILRVAAYIKCLRMRQKALHCGGGGGGAAR